MAEDVFAYLEKDKLVGKGSLDKILYKLKKKELVELSERCAELIICYKSEVIKQSPFDFSASYKLSGLPVECEYWGCREKAAKNLASFSALYCDKVQVANIFTKSYGAFISERFDKDRLSEIDLRKRILGDILSLYSLKDPVREGIVRFKDTTRLCPSCFEKMSQVEGSLFSKMNKAAKSLIREINATSNVTLERNDNEVTLDIRGDERLLGGGERMLSFLKAPPILNPYINSNTTIIPKNLNTKLKLGQKMVDSAVNGLLNQKFNFGNSMNLNYLTSTPLEYILLERITTKDLKQTDMLTGVLNGLPIIENIPVSKVIKIRKSERESFEIFRNSLGSILNGKRKEENLPDLIQKEVSPHILELNKKLKNSLVKTASTTVRSIIVNTAVVTIGSLMPGDTFTTYIPQLLLPFLCKDTKEIYNNWINSNDELRNDNYFFLWKLNN